MITKSAAQTKKVGEGIAQKIKNGGVVCLYGDLGAGKTTLVQGIARGLGIKRQIVSPTFIIIRQYKIKIQKTKVNYLWHIDLYRLQNIDEAKEIGIEEIVADPENITLIEWPEKIESILPKKRMEIKLQTVSEKERKLEIIRR